MNNKNKVTEVKYTVPDDKITDFMSKTKGKLQKDDEINVSDDKKPIGSATSSLSLSENGGISKKLRYLSNVKDANTGEISKPFTKSGKNYQVVRCLDENEKLSMGVYSLDETDENGENVIYHIDEFENKLIQEEGNLPPSTSVVGDAKAAQVGPSNSPSSAPSNLNPLNLSEFKHFFVDKTSGKMRKFKTDEDLAKAQLGENEVYMKVHDLKKFVDETVFGNRKRGLAEYDMQGEQSEEELHAKAAKLMKLIATKIPQQAINTIKANKLAQKEVILAFSELIGVPRALTPKIITGIKNQSKVGEQPPIDSNPQPTSAPKPMGESIVMKKKDLIESVIPKKTTTIKVKEIKNGL